MKELPPRPVLTWREIEAKADDFCAAHNLAGCDYPLDLEAIANFDLGIEIRLADSLIEECGSPAQIALESGSPVITVDAAQYRADTGFYRFSLAHEIAHWLLHREWLEGVYALIQAVEDWKRIFRSIKEDDYYWLESQAEECAAYLIAPTAVFDGFLSNQIERVLPHLNVLGLEDLLPYLANPVSQHFGMTPAAAQARIRKSRVWRDLAARRNEDEIGGAP